MDIVDIDICEDDSIFLLTGNIDRLVKSPRKRLYLTDFLQASIFPGLLKIPFEQGNEELILSKIQELLKTEGIVESRSQLIDSLFKRLFDENLKFTEFSNQARSIRNNELSPTQKTNLQEFVDELKNLIPNRKLYGLQLLSAYHLAYSQNACNFSVPGAGKTSIVYGAYAHLRNLPPVNNKHVSKLIIIGPLSSFGPWEMEYKECFGLAPNSIRLSGGVDDKIKRTQFFGSHPHEIMLFSYNSIPTNQSELIYFLQKYPAMVVLDEAHKIKNIDGGVWATSVLEIARYCSSRVVLTGTPAPNGYEDLYNLFKFIWPTKEIVKFYPYQLKEMNDLRHDSGINSLITNISPFFIRIRKSDLGLPKPIEHDPIIVEMGEIQNEIYSEIEKKYMAQLGKDIDVNRKSAKDVLKKAKLIRLMQASINPSLLIKPLEDYYSESGWVDDFFIEDDNLLRKIIDYKNLEIPPKFIIATKMIKELISQGEKVLVWTIFIQNIIEFNEYLRDAGILSEFIYGATPIESDDSSDEVITRESIIREFHKKESKFDVLIANPFAVAESISLHKACHNAIYLDRNFNAGTYIQSKDRIHRYGLNPNDRINYYYLVSENNIDRTIHNRLLEKERRMLEIIENEPIPLFKILECENEEYEDLRQLINNYEHLK